MKRVEIIPAPEAAAANISSLVVGIRGDTRHPAESFKY